MHDMLDDTTVIAPSARGSPHSATPPPHHTRSQRIQRFIRKQQLASARRSCCGLRNRADRTSVARDCRWPRALHDTAKGSRKRMLKSKKNIPQFVRGVGPGADVLVGGQSYHDCHRLGS